MANHDTQHDQETPNEAPPEQPSQQITIPLPKQQDEIRRVQRGMEKLLSGSS